MREVKHSHHSGLIQHHKRHRRSFLMIMRREIFSTGRSELSFKSMKTSLLSQKTTSLPLVMIMMSSIMLCIIFAPGKYHIALKGNVLSVRFRQCHSGSLIVLKQNEIRARHLITATDIYVRLDMNRMKGRKRKDIDIECCRCWVPEYRCCHSLFLLQRRELKRKPSLTETSSRLSRISFPHQIRVSCIKSTDDCPKCDRQTNKDRKRQRKSLWVVLVLPVLSVLFMGHKGREHKVPFLFARITFFPCAFCFCRLFCVYLFSFMLSLYVCCDVR